MAVPFDVDALLAKVRCSTLQQFPIDVTYEDIRQLCNEAMDVFKKEQTLVRIQPPVNICADIHGHFQELLSIFTTLGAPPDKKYLFLGDYVDRGPRSLEVVVLLFSLKVKYPESVVLLRGNHETSDINFAYGFYEEIGQRYPENSQQLFDVINDTFAWMPYVGLVGNKFLCVHGGVSDRITSLEQLANLRRPLVNPPSPSLEIDLMWSVAFINPVDLSAGTLMTTGLVDRICRLINVELIFRGHEDIQSGYLASGRLTTLMSIRNYIGMGNTGAVITAEHSTHNVTYFPP